MYQVVVSPASAIIEKDLDTHSKMDPYVHVTIGNQSQKTTIIENGGKTPVWKDTLTFNNVKAEDVAIMRIYDKDIITDDFIGEVQVPIAELLSKGGHIIEKKAFLSKANSGYLSYSIHSTSTDAKVVSTSPILGTASQIQQSAIPSLTPVPPPGLKPTTSYTIQPTSYVAMPQPYSVVAAPQIGATPSQIALVKVGQPAPTASVAVQGGAPPQATASHISLVGVQSATQGGFGYGYGLGTGYTGMYGGKPLPGGVIPHTEVKPIQPYGTQQNSRWCC